MKRPNRRVILAAAVLAMSLVGGTSSPTRRGEFACTGFGTCGPSPLGPRMLEVDVNAGTQWTASTDFPDQAKSWDVDLSVLNGSAQSEDIAYATGLPPVQIKWAGDETSTLVMMRESTRYPRLLPPDISGPFSAPLATPFPGDAPGDITNQTISDPTDLFYSEVTWPWAVASGFVVNGGQYAEWYLPQSPLAFSPQGGSWPSEIITTINSNSGAHLFPSPYFRLYDHGVCSAIIPWTGSGGPFGNIQNQITKGSSQVPGVGAKLQTGATYDLTLTAISATLYPILSTVPIDFTDMLGRTYKGVSPPNDSMAVSGSFSYHFHGKGALKAILFAMTGSTDADCDGSGTFGLQFQLVVDHTGAHFPNRVQAVAVHQELDPGQPSCDFPFSILATAYDEIVAVDPGFTDPLQEARDKMQNALDGILYTVQQSTNTGLTPLAPQRRS